MKKIASITFWSFIIILVAANIFLFCSSISLGDQINDFEQKTNKLHLQNIRLEKEVSRLSSLQFAKDVAENLDFIEKSEPVYLDKLGVAFKY